jgi:xanthine dehydrogenase accessory factor
MDTWEVIAQQRREGVPCVVVTVLSVRGSVPCEVGGKAVINADGILAGTIGGGKVEAKAIAVAQGLLNADHPCVEQQWNLQRDVGMTCGGEMRLLFEPLMSAPSWQVVIFGAGHVAQALVQTLARLRCRVDVIDPREQWLEKLSLAANVKAHHVAHYADGVSLVTRGSMVVCVTQGHSTDRPVLSLILRQIPEVRFLGVIGSAAKRAVLMRELREDGHEEALTQRIVCPLGLPLGSNEPEEIAISITSQLLQERDR